MTIDTELPNISVTCRGEVDEDLETYATDKIGRLVSGADGPVLFAEVTLRQEPDPARERPATAEAVLDVNGEPVRAHVAAFEMRAAIDLLEARLRRRLERHAHVRDDRRARVRPNPQRGPGEWRHGDAPVDRPEYFVRPVDEREIVRRKSFAVGALTPDEAADELDLLGHDFLLFSNFHTGSDAVIWYAEDHELELIDASDRDDALGPDTVAPIRLSKLGAPVCTVAEAEEQLDLDLTKFVFFVDADTGRGNIVYHRFDGNYGLISPA